MAEISKGGRVCAEGRPTYDADLAAKKTADEKSQKWSEVREDVISAMQRDGIWSNVHVFLVDEYVGALRLAEEARSAMQEAPFHVSPKTGRSIAHPGWQKWDQAVRRAMRMADMLAITPRARKRLGITPQKPPARDDFAEFDGPNPFREFRDRRNAIRQQEGSTR